MSFALAQVVDDPDTDSLLMILENAEGGSLEAPAVPGAPSGSGLAATLPEHTILQHVRDICKVRIVGSVVPLQCPLTTEDIGMRRCAVLFDLWAQVDRGLRGVDCRL